MQGKMSEINLAKILMKNIKIIGSTLRQRSTEEKQRLIQAACSKFLPMINSGKVKPVIAKVFDFKDYEKAHEYLKKRQNIGKVILQVK
jgi:NADPH2:quinone reductase